MLQSDFVDILFRLINFGVLAGLGVYIFYTKLLGPIRDQIKEKEVFWRNLKQNRKSLIEQQDKLNEEITWQDEHAHDLMKKIGHWRVETDQQQAMLIKEKELYAQKAEARAKKQADEYQMRLVAGKAVPLAFDQAQKDLDKKFADDVLEQKYLDDVIKELRKSVS